MNRKAFNGLPTVNPSFERPTYGMLSRIDGKQRFELLLMPKELTVERSGEFPVTSNGINPFVTWSGEQPEIMSFTVPIAGYPDKDVTAYSDKLMDLRKPDPQKKTPPLLIWRWGQRTFTPCIMPSCSRREFDWYPSGKLKSCEVSITLLKVNRNSVVL